MSAWRDLQDTLIELIELAPSERHDRLSALYAEDAERAQELERLLSASEQTRWDQQMAGAAAADLVVALGENIRQAENLTDHTIGAWRLQRLLGHGGMGAVYLAERADGVYQQRTALKVVPGRSLDSAAGERFVNERQILAQLEHPHIARLLDGGLTEHGAPYLVMEYVDGPDLLSYVRDQAANLETRLALFDDLLAAVQFAHANLIVHGDLKPDNVLVDSRGQLKLLDFGTARVLDRANASEILALTPGYASPERLAGGPLTTGCDIYSLGVLLFRLLAEQPPYDITGVAPDAQARFVVEAEVPSLQALTRLTDVGMELEWICRRAMSAATADRYSSVDNLRQDLARLRAHEPVAAHPPSRGYRGRKFVRRHRLGVAAATMVMLAVGGGAIAALLQADKARAQAARAEQVSGFLASLFDAANPFGVWKEEKSVTDLLEYADTRATVELADDPATRAQVQSLLGTAFLGNGDYDRAVSIHESALLASQTAHGTQSIQTAVAHNHLAHALIEKGEYEAAQEHATRALTQFEVARDNVKQANALTNLAVAVSSLGNRDEARTLHQRALVIREAHLPLDHVSVADSKMSLASVSAALGDMANVLPLNQAAYDIYLQHYGSSHPMTVRAMNGVASGQFLAGNYAAAVEGFRTLLEGAQSRLGADHPELALLYNNLGRALMEQGQLEAAATAYQEAATRVSAAPEQRLLSISARFNQAVLQAELGHFERALPQLKQAGDDMRALLGPDHPLSYRAAVQLASSEALARRSGVQPRLEKLIHEAAGATTQPAWQARARIALTRYLLQSGNTVSAATEISAAAAILETELSEDSWRLHDLLMLKAIATEDTDAQQRYAQRLMDRLPTTSVRRRYAEQFLRQQPRTVPYADNSESG